MKKNYVLGILMAGLFCTTGFAQTLPKTHLKVVGGLANLAAYMDYERPFWTDVLPALSNGQVTAEIRGFSEMGLKGPEILRLISQGVIEFGTATMSYFAGDNPIYEAIDLAGLTPDAESARAVAEVFEPIYQKHFDAGTNVKILGISPYPAQVIFCNAEIRGAADMKGKKVRTSGRSQAEFVEALGGTSVTMPFGEVVPALQNRVVDCAITGSHSGFTAKWYEVSTHLYTLPVNWNAQLHGANKKAFEKLDPGVQKLLLTNLRQMYSKMWDAADKQTQEGYDCNSGVASCPYPEKGKMILVKPTQADLDFLKKTMQEIVLPKWAARCSAECVDDFNKTIGKKIGVTAKK